ncbi:MAG: hypothetical protein J0I19_05985 [Alphaproteobacteria bacterium]|nr:hypothetical protein [Alphaproteobacteria bacterium]
MSEAERAVQYLTEFSMGAAVLGAFILKQLEEKGVLNHAETAKALSEAVGAIPETMAGHPRYSPLIALNVLTQDPQMRFATPFQWQQPST